jgi:hypothetical protein
MKILHMITSCKRDRGNGSQDVCRMTWIRQWGTDYKFFIGRDNEYPMQDEVQFDVNDTFNHVVEKEHLAFQWAIDHGYDYAYLSSPDCYRIIPRMLETPFSEHDYMGSQVLHSFYAGGMGFWLSRRALEVLANSPVCWDFPDKAVGLVLAKAGIKLHADGRYLGAPGQCDGRPFDPKAEGVFDNMCGVNLGRGPGNFKPQWMYDCHEGYMRHSGEVAWHPV